jgi:hypothetical protein
MASFRTSAEALIEIINLCEQTLTALHRDCGELAMETNSGQDRQPERLRRSKSARHLLLIKGGLSTNRQQLKTP